MNIVCSVFLAIIFSLSHGYAQKAKTDRDDDELKGQVQKVVIEKAKLSKVGAEEFETRRELSEVVTYDNRGDRVRRETYDKEGLLETEVYGYEEGDRVVKTELSAGGRERLGGIGPGPAPHSDLRYSIKFKYKYDSQGNRTEVARLRNNDRLTTRSVRRFDNQGNKIEESIYALNGSRIRKVSNLFDSHGNITESSHDLADDRFDSRYSYTYEFDAQGNWTKKVTSEWVTKDGKSTSRPYLITYRTLTYF